MLEYKGGLVRDAGLKDLGKSREPLCSTCELKDFQQLVTQRLLAAVELGARCHRKLPAAGLELALEERPRIDVAVRSDLPSVDRPGALGRTVWARGHAVWPAQPEDKGVGLRLRQACNLLRGEVARLTSSENAPVGTPPNSRPDRLLRRRRE